MPDMFCTYHAGRVGLSTFLAGARIDWIGTMLDVGSTADPIDQCYIWTVRTDRSILYVKDSFNPVRTADIWIATSNGVLD
jgi:hypothetical protein